MRKNLLLFLSMFIFIACSFLVLAYGTSTWYQQGNLAYLTTFPAIVGYGSPYQNVFNSTGNESYEKCDLPAGDYEIIGGDINNDGLFEIAIPSTTTLSIYNQDCEFLTSFSGSFFTGAMINWNSDSYLDFLFGNATHFMVIGYNETSGNIEQLKTSKSANSANCPIACMMNLGYCYYRPNTQDNMYKLDLNTLNSTLLRNVGDTTAFPDSLSAVRYYSNSEYRILDCLDGTTPSPKTCRVYNEDGDTTLTLSLKASATQAAGLHNAYGGYLGNSFYYFTRTRAPWATGFLRMRNEVFNSVGTSVYYQENYNYSSNWAVADYNKDGDNEACLLYSNSTTTYFRCLNKYLSVLVDVDISGLGFSHTTYNEIVLADFQVNVSTLGVGTSLGIFYVNGTSPYWFFQSGDTGTGHPIVISPVQTLVPALIYSDSGGGWVIRNTALLTTCGDGTCSGYENSFTCPDDCNIIEPSEEGTIGVGDYCDSDSDCISTYCNLMKQCQLKNFGMDCSADSECMSGECSNSKCTKPSYWELIDATKDETAGDDTNTNNIISLILCIALAMIFLVGGIMLHAEGSAMLVVSGLVFVIGIVFFTIVGWLSPFILFGAFLLGVIIAAIQFIGSSGG